MNTLVSAFWGEGISDKRFLPILIQRTLEEIMLDCAEGEWDILEPILMHPSKQATNFADQVLDLARQTKGFRLLFVHTDADAPNEDAKAIPWKISPAQEALNAESVSIPTSNFPYLVPVIPVVKIENWKLSDTNALREALGTNLDEQALGLNIGSRQLEEKNASKELLTDILRTVNIGRRIPIELQDLDAALAKTIALNNIYRFRSFQKFVERLKEALLQQNIIKVGCQPAFTN